MHVSLRLFPFTTEDEPRMQTFINRPEWLERGLGGREEEEGTSFSPSLAAPPLCLYPIFFLSFSLSLVLISSVCGNWDTGVPRGVVEGRLEVGGESGG